MRGLLLVILFSPLWALPIGNTLSPALYDHGLWDKRDPIFSWGACTHLRFGYYGDFVFNRDVEEMSHSDPGKEIQRLKLATNAFDLTLDVCDSLDVFILVGATKLSYQTESAFGEYGLFDFSTATSWSFGGALELWQCGFFGMGIEGQYFQVRPLLDSYTNVQNGQMIYFNNLNCMKWREWQGGITFNFTFEDDAGLLFSPYMGIKASCGKLRQHGFQFLDDGLLFTLDLLQTRKLWGYGLGLTVVSRGIMGVTVEGRWADEKALYGNVQLSY